MAESSQENGSKQLEKELFKYTLECNYEQAKYLITVENVHVDCVDEDGTTPLQQAAYKGDYKLCKLFLDCGANVNATTHVSRYSALTFASLSGNIDVVNLLLEHGASTTSVNSINKTASQMAAFVGNHHIVSIINNYLPIEEIEYFTKIHGLEKEPKLPAVLSQPVHKLVVITNINPVKIAMFIQATPVILDNSIKVARVLNILSEKMFKDQCNELLSLKYHHLAFVLNACEKFYLEQKSKCSETTEKFGKDVLTPLIKRWICGDKNGFPIGLEKFLRQDVREYPYLECTLFQQLVRTLATGNIGEEPSAISIINEAVTGQRGFNITTSCVTCSDPNAEKKCSACKSVQYCDKTCQKLHWFTHKNFCAELKKTYEEEKLKEVEEGVENNSEAKEL
ncbi:ankyrin repeat and MYND domain-containing protein 2 [Parasteatoda tepidariorum]|uniref:ankyrin repeat and MYND domain-containing protein 2 n=1 Tax=Parasteatoda tepidariorum TaxID=114398 RepID=UPI001C72814A|nr:ankyrin repeat and MYND domain-containing protein 2-like [Parasteatoda tepidariorum]